MIRMDILLKKFVFLVTIIACVTMLLGVKFGSNHKEHDYQKRLKLMKNEVSNCKPYHNYKYSTVHLATTICGLRIKDALVMLWSALLFTERVITLHFHLIVSSEVHQRLTKELISWKICCYHNFDYTLYAKRSDLYFPRSKLRPCTTQRLFLPDIIHCVDSVLYVDTDVVFIDSVTSIWHFMESKLNATNIAAFSHESESPRGTYQRSIGYRYYKPYGLNAGVFLFNLTKARSNNWNASIHKIYADFSELLLYSDQDIINIYFEENRDKLFKLPCSFNFRPIHCDPKAMCLNIAPSQNIIALHGSSDAFRLSQYQRPRLTIFRKIYEEMEKILIARVDLKEIALSRLKPIILEEKRKGTCSLMYLK